METLFVTSLFLVLVSGITLLTIFSLAYLAHFSANKKHTIRKSPAIVRTSPTIASQMTTPQKYYAWTHVLGHHILPR
jgi:hypothetical protein